MGNIVGLGKSKNFNWNEKDPIVPELYHMTGTTNELKQNRMFTAQSNQIKFNEELLAITQRVINAQFSRAKHFSSKWLFDFSKLKDSMRPRLIAKDTLKPQKEKPMVIKNWMIIHDEELSGVGKVRDYLFYKNDFTTSITINESIFF